MTTKPYIDDARNQDIEFWFDEAMERWIVCYRGRPGQVRANAIRIETACHGLGKRLTCRAEVLCDGVTNHRADAVDASVVTLRTAIVYDQIVAGPATMQLATYGRLG